MPVWLANPLARHYSRFRVGERLLLTGHSHQAWPDVGFDAQQRAWLDAAEYVDEKWEKAEMEAACGPALPGCWATAPVRPLCSISSNNTA